MFASINNMVVSQYDMFGSLCPNSPQNTNIIILNVYMLDYNVNIINRNVKM